MTVIHNSNKELRIFLLVQELKFIKFLMYTVEHVNQNTYECGHLVPNDKTDLENQDILMI